MTEARTRLSMPTVLIPLALLLPAVPVEAKQPGKGPVKVFILAGQSNMEGFGTVEGDRKGTLRSLLADPNTAERYKHLVDKDGKWVTRDDVWVWRFPDKNGERKGKLTVGYGAKPAYIGPEYGFGLAVGEALTNQVLLIKVAWGGKSLAKDFRPPSAGGETGPFYTDLIRHVREVLANLKKHFPAYDGAGYEIAGFGWHQGWNDGCGWPATREYEQNLIHFIGDVRKEFRRKDLPFVIANSGFAGWKQRVDRRLAILEAQAAAAKHFGPEGKVACVETRGFFRPYPSRHNYHWNFNGETQYLVGEAMGKAMVRLLGAGRAGGQSN